jgi:hypothetical protein
MTAVQDKETDQEHAALEETDTVQLRREGLDDDLHVRLVRKHAGPVAPILMTASTSSHARVLSREYIEVLDPGHEYHVGRNQLLLVRLRAASTT